MSQDKKNYCPKKIGCLGYLNENCWLARTLKESPSKRCGFCSLKFSQCLFIRYVVISLVLVTLLLATAFTVEGKITNLVIICIFVLVVVYGYFFNQSTEKIIEANFSQIEAMNALEELTEKLEEKVDAQTRDLRAKNIYQANLTHSIERANLRLQELDRQKTEFLSIASHQLRTPLSIIKGYIELIKDGAYGKTTTKMVKTLDEMDQSNERLVKLVDEFLNISRIEQGRTKFDFKPENLNEIISSVVKELKEKADEKCRQIVWTPPPPDCQANVDEEKIRNVVFNYIDNALKYSDCGEVKVFLESEDDGWNVRVCDNGLGFGKVDGANFFQKFYRGENVKGANVNGTGLGLYVCRKFIEAHNGKVWAKSGGLGKGSEFGFWIPLAFSPKT